MTAHANHQWVKKVDGKLYGFGRWNREDVTASALAAVSEYRCRVGGILAGDDRAAAAPDRITLWEVVARFLAYQEERIKGGELSVRTYADYMDACRVMVQALGKNAVVASLGPDEFKRLRSAIPWGVTRMSNAIIWMRGVFNWADQERLIPRLPQYGASFSIAPRRAKRKARRESRQAAGAKLYEPCHLHLLLAGADPILRAWIYLGLNGGLGNTDLSELPRAVVDLDHAYIDFPRPKTEIAREIPLWPETVAALREALPRRPATAHSDYAGMAFLTPGGFPLVYVRQHDGMIVKSDAVAQRFAAHCDLCGIPRRGFYALRHVFETVADETGRILAVSRIMGHEFPGMKSAYNELIHPADLRAVTDHVRAWLMRPAPGTPPASAAALPPPSA